MSYSLAVADGDLVQSGSRLGLVFGMDKLRQDLNCWLMERHGGDRFHPDVGSILQRFIGGVVNGRSQVEVQSEVLRVLDNYQSLQVKRFRENPEKLSVSEILGSVSSVRTSVDYDTVRVSVGFRNGEEQYETLRLSTTA